MLHVGRLVILELGGLESFDSKGRRDRSYGGGPQPFVILAGRTGREHKTASVAADAVRLRSVPAIRTRTSVSIGADEPATGLT